MNNLSEQFNNPQSSQQFQSGQPMQNQSVTAHSSASREIEEVKGAIFLAKQFPRNMFEAQNRILDNCKRPALAASSMYSYPKGGTKVTGPSIRLAEVLARNWGNLSYGIKELEQRDGESVAMAYCWDLETNVRQEKVFTVKHSIYRKQGGPKLLLDPRDIYEKVANDGARRLRACILGVIPGDIVDLAVEECTKTLAGQNEGPLKERIVKALTFFKEKHGVTQEMIEVRFGYNASSFSEFDLVQLTNIRNSLKDGMSTVEDWFSKEEAKKVDGGLATEFEKSQEQPKTEVKSDAPNQNPIEQPELPLE
ncbi:hypothetical protein [Lysinibacillus piscis]|uniref:Uncharacterized protein n=1 Tax=Lysinibacillus piscis TaxID=2518931 RepID=A0ABQ5NJW7_9BACI|nr:hypothetical protein [Lysinibacillus sp. KH24]GLC88666.1 hypothetical protein LYSBPC_17930 [Lysinibacillus sp. KH24]